MRSNINSLTSDLESMSIKFEESQTMVQSQSEEHSGLLRRYEELQAALRDSQASVSLLEADSSSKSNMIKELEVRISMGSEERDMHLGQIVYLEGDVEKKREYIARIESTLEQIQQRLGDSGMIALDREGKEKEQLIEELNSFMEKNFTLEATVSEYQKQLSELSTKLSNYDRDAAEEQELFARAAESEMDNLRFQLKEAAGDAAQARTTLQSKEEECVKLSMMLQSKLDMNQAEADSLASMNNQIHELRSTLFSMQSERDELRKTLACMKDDVAQQLDVKDKRIAHLEASKLTKDQMEKIKIIKDERRKFYEENKELKRQLEMSSAKGSSSSSGVAGGHSTAEVLDLKSQIERNQLVIKTHKDKLKECLDQLKEYEGERSAVIDCLEKFGVDCNVLRLTDLSYSMADDFPGGCKDLPEAVGQLGQRVVDLNHLVKAATQSRHEEMTSSLDAIRLQLRESESTRMNLEKEVAKLKAALKMMKDDSIKMSIDNDSMRLRISELERDLSAFSSQASNNSGEMASQVKALEEENTELYLEIKKLKQDMKKHLEAPKMSVVGERGALLPTKGISGNAGNAVYASAVGGGGGGMPGGGLKTVSTHLMQTHHHSDDSSRSNSENAERDMKRAAKSAKIVRSVREGGNGLMAVDEDRPAECNQS